jgi:LysM repeat protein
MKSRLLIVLVLVALLAALVPVSGVHADSCKWHVVKRGENLTQIARHYGVSKKAILKANPKIKNPSLIYTGQRLCIPKSSPKPPPSPPTGKCETGCWKTYYVKPGEWLKLIGERYGKTAACLAKVNHISNPNYIYPGQKLRIPVKCTPKPPTPPTPPPVKKAWKGLYWTNRDQAGNPKFTRNVNAINMDWGMGGPQGLGKTDNFSIRWTRTMHFDEGNYLFIVKVKDGVRVLVDGNMLIDQWHEVPHPAAYNREIRLHRGTHTIRVDYFDGHGPAQAHVDIERVGGVLPPHPKPKPEGPWQARYWNNTRFEGPPVWGTKYKDIVFDWGRGSPHPGVSADFFSAKYIGKFDFPDGKYRFYATVDDGVKIFLDNQLIMDEWRIQARRTFTSDVHIPGGEHEIKVIYFEETGIATLKVMWTKIE